jgi:hypothetical protein
MRLRVLVLFVAVSFPTSLIADTIFSSFGPGNPYAPELGTDIGGMSGQEQVLAVSFVPDITATLADVQLPLNMRRAGAPPISVYIGTSLSDGEPGAVLDELTQVGTIGLTTSLVEFTCSSCVQLVAGETYFVFAVPSASGDPDEVTEWDYIVGDHAPFYFNESGVPSEPWIEQSGVVSNLPALEVDGTPVNMSSTPEPSTLVLLGTGVMGVAGVVRRRLARA